MDHLVALEGAHDGDPVHHPRQLREEPVGDVQAVADLAHVEVRLRAGVFLEVEGVNVADRAGGLDHDREARSPSWIGAPGRADARRPEALADQTAEEAPRTKPQGVATGQRQVSNGAHGRSLSIVSLQ